MSREITIAEAETYLGTDIQIILRLCRRLGIAKKAPTKRERRAGAELTFSVAELYAVNDVLPLVDADGERVVHPEVIARGAETRRRNREASVSGRKAG